MSIKVTFFQIGYCTHPEAIVVRGGKWKPAIFPSLCALISHPSIGYILFDTGYSNRFFQETRHFPFRLYALTTPVHFQPEDSAVSQLEKHGIEAAAVKNIIISHFHADHVGGLRDFPNARFLCFQSAYNAVRHRRGFEALMAGFLVNLLPPDFEQRTTFVETEQLVSLPECYAPFDTGFDIFQDGTMIVVELPGHATGQLGLFLTDADNQTFFLIADACWLSCAYQEFVTPHPIANLIFSNRQEYVTTLQKIHQLHKLNPEIKIIPTHCPDAWDLLKPSNKKTIN